MIVFLVFNIVEGFAVAWSYPAKQAFLVQVVPPRWLGSVQGLDQSAVQVGALVGTLVAPLLYTYMSGYVISLGGVVTLVGLAIAAPTLRREWHRLQGEAIPALGAEGSPLATEGLTPLSSEDHLRL